MIKFAVLKKPTADNLRDINLLLPQLSSHAVSLKIGELRLLLKNPDFQAVIAKSGKRIVGIGGVLFMRALHFRAGYITDVVVDEQYRGQRIGERIVLKLISLAKAKNMAMAELTSNPRRIAANKMYPKLGFERRETNVYRMKFKK